MNLLSKGFLGVMAIVVSLLFSNASLQAAPLGSGWQSDNTIALEGYGAAPSTSTSSGQARILARRAAIVDAYRNLGEYIEGVRIDSETTVKDMVVRDDMIRTRVSAFIRGAKIISEKMNTDGSCTVVVSVPMYGVSNSLASTVLPSWDNIEAFPDPNFSVLPSYPTENQTRPAYNPKASGTYTGLIVDCRGLGLQPVMSPTIRNSNNEPIYGYKNLDYAKVIEKGMASYSKDGYNNLERAGKNPLVVSAIRLDGHNSNPVLSMEDAQLVLVENQATGFLNSCSVVFIR